MNGLPTAGGLTPSLDPNTGIFTWCVSMYSFRCVSLGVCFGVAYAERATCEERESESHVTREGWRFPRRYVAVRATGAGSEKRARFVSPRSRI